MKLKSVCFGVVPITYGPLIKNNRFWVWSTGIALVVAAMVSAIVILELTTARMTAQHGPLTNAAMKVKYELSLFHLWFEELIQGDNAITESDAWNHLSKARWYANTMLEGGKNLQGRFLPLTEPTSRSPIERVLAQMDMLDRVAKERLTRGLFSRADSAIDQRFDQAFEKVLSDADEVETQLQRWILEDRDRFRDMRLFLLISVPGAGIIMWLVVSWYEIRNFESRKLLSQSNELYRSLFHVSPDAIIVHSGGKILLANPATAKLLAASTPKELEGVKIMDIIHPDFREIVQQRIGETQGTKQPMSLLEEKLLRRDGSTVDVEVSGVGIDFEGKRASQVIIRDITERKKTQCKLLQSQQKYRELFDHTIDAVCLFDAHTHQFLDVNASFEQMYGYTKDEALMLLTEDVSAEPDRTKLAIKQAAEAGHVQVPYRHHKKKDGTTFYVELSGWPFSLAGRKVMYAVMKDVTEREKFAAALAEKNLQLVRAKKEADQANLAKSRFLAAASHDLRQPLTALTMFIAVLKRRSTTDETSEIIGKIENVLCALGSLLNGILDISKLEAGMVAPSKEPIPVGKIMTRLGKEFFSVAADKGLKFRIVPTQMHVLSDPLLLERILRNLLDNAIKYTNDGKILLGCRRHGDRVRIEVWDNGRGIPEEHLEAIFEEFYQVGNLARDKRHGLGLGLAIVRKTAQLLGTQAEVSSIPGKGSVFAIELPLSTKANTGKVLDRSAPNTKATDGLILAIDDDLAVLEGLGMLLDAWGYDVLTLAQFPKAADWRKVIERGRSPDLIIADYRLQEGSSGIAAISRIRRKFGQGIPAILLTGDTDPHRLIEANKSGLPLLHKPVEPEELRVTMLNALASRST